MAVLCTALLLGHNENKANKKMYTLFEQMLGMHVIHSKIQENTVIETQIVNEKMYPFLW